MDHIKTILITKKDNKCFQQAVTVTLNYEEIKSNRQRIIKIKTFINKYNWEGINFSSKKDEWTKFEKNNLTIALNVLYTEKEKIYPAYVSKYNSNHEKQVILLMISNGEICEAKSEVQQWHYLAVKKLSALLRGTTSKHHGGLYCLNCLYSFATEKSYENNMQ